MTNLPMVVVQSGDTLDLISVVEWMYEQVHHTIPTRVTHIDGGIAVLHPTVVPNDYVQLEGIVALASIEESSTPEPGFYRTHIFNCGTNKIDCIVYVNHRGGRNNG